MHDHDHTDEEIPEIEINIEPRLDRLEALGVSQEDFEAAVMDALDRMDQVVDSVDDPDSVPALENVELEIQGRRFSLGEVAEITVSSDLLDDEGDLEGELEGD
jgi:hypothetical protein